MLVCGLNQSYISKSFSYTSIFGKMFSIDIQQNYFSMVLMFMFISSVILKFSINCPFPSIFKFTLNLQHEYWGQSYTNKLINRCVCCTLLAGPSWTYIYLCLSIVYCSMFMSHISVVTSLTAATAGCHLQSRSAVYGCSQMSDNAVSCLTILPAVWQCYQLSLMLPAVIKADHQQW